MVKFGEGEGGKIWENGIETCVISWMKRVASPGSMHDTGCLGLVHWDNPEGWCGEGGGRRVQDGEHMYTCGGFFFFNWCFIPSTWLTLLQTFNSPSHSPLHSFLHASALPPSRSLSVCYVQSTHSDNCWWMWIAQFIKDHPVYVPKQSTIMPWNVTGEDKDVTWSWLEKTANWACRDRRDSPGEKGEHGSGGWEGTQLQG